MGSKICICEWSLRSPGMFSRWQKNLMKNVGTIIFMAVNVKETSFWRKQWFFFIFMARKPCLSIFFVTPEKHIFIENMVFPPFLQVEKSVCRYIYRSKPSITNDDPYVNLSPYHNKKIEKKCSEPSLVFVWKCKKNIFFKKIFFISKKWVFCHFHGSKKRACQCLFSIFGSVREFDHPILACDKKSKVKCLERCFPCALKMRKTLFYLLCAWKCQKHIFVEKMIFSCLSIFFFTFFVLYENLVTLYWNVEKNRKKNVWNWIFKCENEKKHVFHEKCIVCYFHESKNMFVNICLYFFCSVRDFGHPILTTTKTSENFLNSVFQTRENARKIYFDEKVAFSYFSGSKTILVDIFLTRPEKHIFCRKNVSFTVLWDEKNMIAGIIFSHFFIY